MVFKAFPILNMRTGKLTALDPWILPEDAFEIIRNCHLKDGVLEKRRGNSLFGQIIAISTTTLDPTLKTNPVMGIFNHLSGTTQNLLVADKERICQFVSDRPANKTLTAIADQGGSPNIVRFTSEDHTFEVDDIITIIGDSDWNGTYRVEAETANTFDIEHAASDTVVDSGTAATQEAFEDLTKNKIRFKPTNSANGDPPPEPSVDAAQDTQPAGGVTINGVTSGATATLSSGGAFADYGVFGSGTAFGTFVFDNGTVVNGPFQIGEQLNSTGTLDTGDIYGYALAANSDEAFIGDNTKFFWTENWSHNSIDEFIYITNNQNPMQIYDGAHLRQLSIDIGLDSARAGLNNVTKILLVIIFKERVVIFNTEEGGTSFFQRARWSSIKDPFSWPTNNFKDAPTADVITSVDFIGDELYVWFEKGVKRFVSTGDSENPFEWENVSNTEGTVAQMSVVTQDDEQYAVGVARLQVLNGRNVFPSDLKIPDFSLKWNQDSLPYSNAILLDEERQIHTTYTSSNAQSDDSGQPDDGNVYADSILVFNYQDKGYATYSLPVHTFGFSFVESDLTWDDIAEAWEDIDFSWNAGQAKGGFPTTLFGNHLGKIFQMNFGGSDNGSAIEFRAVMAQMNPFVEKGHKAKLGFIRFLCDVDANVTFDVKSFLNTDTTPFQTRTITCDAVNGSDSLVWKQVDVFATANFHRIEITNNASNNRPRIHAIVPHFEDSGGRLI